MKVQMNLVAQSQATKISKKAVKNVLNRMKPAAKMAAIPVMAVPIVAYFTASKNEEIRNTKILKEKLTADKYHTSHTPVTDRTKLNKEALEKAGVNRSDIKDYIKSDGYMTEEGKRICRSNGVTSFKGDPDAGINATVSEVGVNDVMAENIEPLTFGNEITTLEAGMPELSLAEFEELSFADIAAVLENPALQAFAAEILPGTRFLQPLSDLRKGDFAKAGIGTVSRTVEIALAPLKLGWVASGGIMGALLKWGGIDEDYTGFIGGAKHFSMEWARVRDMLENEAIGRETPENPLTPDQAYYQYKNAKEETIKALREKIATRGTEYREKLSKYYENELLNFAGYNEYLKELIEKEDKRQDFYAEQLASIISTGQMDSAGVNKDLQDLQARKIKLQETYNSNMKKLDEYLQNNLSDEKIVANVEKTKKELKEAFDASSMILNEEIEKINNILNVNNLLQQNKNNKGFAKIAGYENIKDGLYTSLVKPLKSSNNGEQQNLPNIILLHGPKGCGKTLMAKSLAEETNSNQIKLRLTLDADKNLANLQDAIKKSLDDYNSSGKHTIIHIDEINGFFKDGQNLEFLSSVAKNNHCTIVGTTNYPEKVNKSVFEAEGFESIFVAPADKRNLMKVARYYLKNIVDAKFDYSKVADTLIENSNGDYYSNARIENFIKNYIKTDFLKANKFDSEIFFSKLQNLKADIRAEQIKNIGKDIK